MWMRRIIAFYEMEETVEKELIGFFSGQLG
jgi:hypothetical protein